MAKRVIIGALVGGVVYFIWGAVFHMVLPFGHMGISTLPSDKEPAALEALKGAAPAAGLYFFPGRDMNRQLSDSEIKEWEAKAKAGPIGVLVITPEGGEGMTPKQLVTELGIDVLVALLASILLSTTRLNYVGRVGFVVLLGLFAWASISPSYWNWYKFPADFTIGAALEEGLGGLVMGLVLAAIVRPSKVEAPVYAEVVAA